MTVMNDKRSILGNQFGFTCIAVIFLITVPMLGSVDKCFGTKYYSNQVLSCR